jgi:tRNA threonylcarbamoyladenosine biosynthesis protein TsaB
MLLALDTSGSAAQAALLGGNRTLLAARSEPMATGHAERLLPLIEDMLAGAGVRYEQLSRIGVTIGPGSFTGMRIALAAALAAEVEGDANVLAVIDARRGEVYAEMRGPGGFPARVDTVSGVVSAIAAAHYRAIGSGADLIASVDARAMPLHRAVPDIATIARLAAHADPVRAPALPLYLRAPDAKPQAGALPRRA